MKKVLGVAFLLWCLLSLSGCMVRMTGPCLGYGCPVGTGGATNARSAAPATQPRQITAKNGKAPARETTVHDGD